MDEEMRKITEMQKALADPTRLRIVRLLLERELCVCEIEDTLGLAQYTVSRHLRVLRKCGLARDRRQGTWMHYGLAPGLPERWRTALTALAAIWESCPQVAEDVRRLRKGEAHRPAEPDCEC